MEKNKMPGMKINPEIKNGKYSNFVRVSHTPFDFLVDFGQALPEDPEMDIFARVIMSPAHAKAFLIVLEENIKQYESSFGPIPSFKGVTNPQFSGIV